MQGDGKARRAAFWRARLAILAAVALVAAGKAAIGADGARAQVRDQVQEQMPRRVVSFNLCADQLLVALADQSQIAGLSPYAANPELSVVAKEAAGMPRLDWSAESVVRLGPDLVLAGPSDRLTEQLLKASGIRIKQVDLVTDIESARKQVIEIAALLGQTERGAGLVKRIDDAAAQLTPFARHPRSAMMIERGGYVTGPGSLAAAMLTRAGLHPPMGAPQGFGGFVALEDLLVMNPDILVLKDEPQAPKDQGALFLTHPALVGKFPPVRRMVLPSRYVMCGGVALAEGLDHLHAILAAMPQ